MASRLRDPHSSRRLRRAGLDRAQRLACVSCGWCASCSKTAGGKTLRSFARMWWGPRRSSNKQKGDSAAHGRGRHRHTAPRRSGFSCVLGCFSLDHPASVRSPANPRPLPLEHARAVTPSAHDRSAIRIWAAAGHGDILRARAQSNGLCCFCTGAGSGGKPSPGVHADAASGCGRVEAWLRGIGASGGWQGDARRAVGRGTPTNCVPVAGVAWLGRGIASRWQCKCVPHPKGWRGPSRRGAHWSWCSGRAPMGACGCRLARAIRARSWRS